MPGHPENRTDGLAPQAADEPPAASSHAQPVLNCADGATDTAGWREFAAALGLAFAGVSAPIAVTATAASSTLLGSPLVASALVGLLVLAPAGVGLATALSGLRRVIATLRTHGIGDAEQAVLRVFAATLLFGYSLGLAAVTANSEPPEAAPYLPVAAFGLVTAWAVLLHVILFPGAPPVRRFGAMALDIAVISAFLHFGGGEVAGWYPLYLLAAFHAGLRFGWGAMLGSTIGSILGFAAVILSTDIWRQQPVLAGGLLLALAVMPALFAGAIQAIASGRSVSATAEADRRRSFQLIADNLRAVSAHLASTGAFASDDEQQARNASGVRAAMSRIGHVADFAAVEAGRFAVPIESFDLRALVNLILAPLQADAAENGVALRWRIDPGLPPRLRGRTEALARIIAVLTAHAVEVTPAGTVRIALHAVWSDLRGLRLRLAVDSADDNRAPGSVIGSAPAEALALRFARRLVTLLGGEFAIDRIAGRRTRLTVTLMLAIENGTAGPIVDLGNRIVLIATEDEGFAGELAVFLDRWNADARWAGDADAALAELARNETPEPSILVIDGRSRGLSALSLAHHAARVGGAAPFILLAADTDQIETLGEIDEGEIDGFIPLPLSEALLANALGALPLRAPGPDRPSVARMVDSPREWADRRSESSAPNERPIDRVTPIAAHPKFVPDISATLDPRAIEGLRALDGSPGFLRELLETFRDDAHQIMQRIDQEVATADSAGFAHSLSALRRAASPLGATRLCELLASFNVRNPGELHRHGAAYVQRLDAEIDRLLAALMEFLPAEEAQLP